MSNAVAGQIAINFKCLNCLDDTNEVGKDEIVFYSVFLLRDPINRRVFTSVVKSSVFNNMDKGKLVINNFVSSRNLLIGRQCVNMKTGNLADFGFQYPFSDFQSTSLALKHINRNWFWFVLMTEHDDSSTSKIHNKITGKVSEEINKPDFFTASETEIKARLTNAINKGFSSGRETSWYKNSDDRIRLVDFIGNDLTVVNEIMNGGFDFSATRRFDGDGGKYELELELSCRILQFDSSSPVPICI